MPLADDLRADHGAYSRDVPPRPRQVGDEPQGNRVAGCHKDDGNRPRRLLGGQRRWRVPRRYDHVDLQTDQLGGELGEQLILPPRIAVLKSDVASLHIALFSQPLLEGVKPHTHPMILKGAAEPEHADPPHLPRLLRFGGERRGEGTKPERANERAPANHWITSSARSSSVCEIVSPSALAVLRLMTSSNLVGCSTGRSAGLAPLRILST